MRVLVAHNFYSKATPSGENDAVISEVAALRGAGLDVALLGPSSDDLPEIALHTKAIRLVTGNLLDSEWLSTFDILHVHNPWPSIGYKVFRRAHLRGVRTVWTLHNYRLDCLSGILFRRGRPCTLCQQRRSFLPGIVHRCYRSSRAQSAAFAVAQMVQTPALSQIDTVFTVAPGMEKMLRRSALFQGRVLYKPNPQPDVPEFVMPPLEGRLRFMFAGRLGVEKGVRIFLEAASLLRAPADFEVAGGGVLEKEVRSAVASRGNVDFLGLLAPAEVLERLRGAVLCVPSMCPEGMPMIIAQALAVGTPVIVSDSGPMASVVQRSFGRVFRSGDPHSLAEQMESIASLGRLDLWAMRSAARRAFLATFEQSRVIAAQIGYYEDMIRSS
ncbi:MAG: glycosyltransferase family 4 protein [Candidatus Dormiibacterota bacterium]